MSKRTFLMYAGVAHGVEEPNDAWSYRRSGDAVAGRSRRVRGSGEVEEVDAFGVIELEGACECVEH
jgi:hypothetical protein